MDHLAILARALLVTFALVALVASFLTLIPKCGQLARKISERFSRAPLLDIWIAALTWIPWLIAGIARGWIGVVGALIGQFFVLYLWCFLHEVAHRDAARGPRIIKFINRSVGRWQNHLALWVTLIALPGFWVIRFVQIFAYWPLELLLNFPKYKHADWINVSRHKFDGLVGHDLIWCLYCDWMTGVYSLGAEMLRNVESFWCPIRFYDGRKCDNCKLDFPDIETGWIAPGKTMADVENLLEEKYGGGRREWFGHPARLTIHGKPAHDRKNTES